jgi:hypothetical protein
LLVINIRLNPGSKDLGYMLNVEHLNTKIVKIILRNMQDKAGKTLFSKSDLFHMADKIVDMYDRMDLIRKFYVMNNDDKALVYSGILWELELLIKAYGLREMVKIS